MAKKAEDIIRDEILALSAYQVPDATGLIKLDAMENPYGLPADLRGEIAACVENAALNRYPDPAARELKTRLHETMQVPAGMELMLGNGSDDLIQTLMLAVAKPGAVMLGCEPSFAMFELIATFARLRYIGVPLTEQFALDTSRMLAAIEEYQPALMFIAYPNNPTGNLFDTRTLERMIDAAPGLVVIDEAYHPFAGRTFMPRLADFPNLLVMRTLSKLGLAGIRLGLLAGRPEWLHHIDKLRLPYNVGVLTQLVATTALRDRALFDKQAAAIKEERTRLLGQLRRMATVQAYDSDANFILFRVADAGRTFSQLKTRGVLIKNLDGTHPLLAGCLRVTVGTPDENARFLEALMAIEKP